MRHLRRNESTATSPYRLFMQQKDGFLDMFCPKTFINDNATRARGVQSRSNGIGRNTLSCHLNKSTRYRGKIVVQVSHPHAEIRAIADAIEAGPRGTGYYHTKSRIRTFKHATEVGRRQRI